MSTNKSESRDSLDDSERASLLDNDNKYCKSPSNVGSQLGIGISSKTLGALGGLAAGSMNVGGSNGGGSETSTGTMACIKMTVLVLLCCQNAGHALMTRYSQGILRETYSSAEVVLTSEFIKLVVSGYLMMSDQSESGMYCMFRYLHSAQQLKMLVRRFTWLIRAEGPLVAHEFRQSDSSCNCVCHCQHPVVLCPRSRGRISV
jgi:hypothetical protein